MNFTLSSKPISDTKADCLVVALPEKGDWPASTTQANEALGGLIKTLQKNGDATGKNATTQLIPLEGQPWARLLLVGTGIDKDRTPANYRKALIAVAGQIKDGPSKHVLIGLSDTVVTGEDATSSGGAVLPFQRVQERKSVRPQAWESHRCRFIRRQDFEGCLQSWPGYGARHELHPRPGQHTTEHLPSYLAGRAG